MLSPIFEKFFEKSPISVMARGMMERVLNPSQLDQWFKHPRGPKKPRPKRKSCKNTPHVSTAKILAQRNK